MRNLVVVKASAGMSTMVTSSGIQALRPPEPPWLASPAAALASPSGLAPSAFLSDIVESALQVHQFLEHLIAGGDDARVGLVGALCGNEVRELGGEIDVGEFERPGLNPAQPIGARCRRRRSGRA